MAAPSCSVTERDEFSAILGRMIELIDGKLSPLQREKLAAAMPSIQWEFPDADTKLCLAASTDALRVAAPVEHAPFVVRMARSTLEDAAFGRRSLGAAFLAGLTSHDVLHNKGVPRSLQQSWPGALCQLLPETAAVAVAPSAFMTAMDAIAAAKDLKTCDGIRRKLDKSAESGRLSQEEWKDCVDAIQDKANQLIEAEAVTNG